MVNCQNCGTWNDDTNKFCGECGAKLPDIENYCPKCDKTYRTEKFCTQCGTKLVNKENFQKEQIKKQKISQLEDLLNKSQYDKNVLLDMIYDGDDINISSNEKINYLVSNYSFDKLKYKMNYAENVLHDEEVKRKIELRNKEIMQSEEYKKFEKAIRDSSCSTDELLNIMCEDSNRSLNNTSEKIIYLLDNYSHSKLYNLLERTVKHLQLENLSYYNKIEYIQNELKKSPIHNRILLDNICGNVPQSIEYLIENYSMIEIIDLINEVEKKILDEKLKK